MTTTTIPAAALSQHVAIVGKTGSGKTSTAKLIVEQVVAEGARVCVLDPIKSDWWGVISSADGKRPGLPFHVLGGPHAHVPLHSGAGAAIGELVARGELTHSILDMADFEPGGQQRFFVAFADTLLKRMRGVLYLVLEEAHEFAPKERAGFEKENLAIHFAKKLATAGRSKGIRLILATQRTQSLHNALLGSCDTLIAHRLTAPADQEPVTKWLKANVDKDTFQRVAAELSSLKTGTGWLCSGEARVFERIQFPRIRTFDNSATPTDDAGEVHVHGGHVDLEALRALIGTAVAEAEANDPKKLKAEIARLKKQVADLQEEGAGAERLEEEYRQGHVDGKRDGLAEAEQLASERAARAVAELRASVRPNVEALYHALANGSAPTPGETTPSIPAPKTATREPISGFREPKRPIRETPVRRRARPRPSGEAQTSLAKGERAVLTAVAQHDAGVSREQLTVLTGYKRSSRDTYLQKLGAAGFVKQHAGGVLLATESGLDALGDDFEPLPTGDELRRHWLEKLPQGERIVLEHVVAAYPESIDRDAISEATGYKRSSRDTYLQKLIARKLVEAEGRGRVVASDSLFD